MRDRLIQVRVSAAERRALRAAAIAAGHGSLASWVRWALLREAQRKGAAH